VTAADPGWRRWLWRLRWGLPLLAVPLVVWVFVVWQTGRELREAEERADHLDPGWRLDDLLAATPHVPHRRTAAVVVPRPSGLVRRLWLGEPPDPTVLNRLDALPLGVPPHDSLRREVSAALDQAADALSAALPLIDLPTGRFPYDRSPDPLA